MVRSGVTAEAMGDVAFASAAEDEKLKQLVEQIREAALAGKWSIEIARPSVDALRFLKYLGYEFGRADKNESIVIQW